MRTLIQSLLVSPAFAALWDFISDNWTIHSDNMMDDTPYRLEDGAIIVSSQILPGRIASVVATALRDAWQEDQIDDHVASTAPYHPESVVHLERVRRADAITFAIKVAWELREAGQFEMWRCMLSDRDGDMAQAFFDVMEQHKFNPCIEAAMEAAFIQWYQDMDRIIESDRAAMNLMDVLLDDQEDLLSLNASRLMMTQRLSQMGCQIDGGRTYLSAIASDLQRDPFFAAMDDPVSQTHLLHIIKDLQSVRVQDIAFRDQALAQRLFPFQETVLYN